ncbi:MAG: hypothetical protein H0U92_05265 [Actinobacteria bacterium]|nr:hypothetical protein [Actinomycetota bacterium]
MKFADAGRGFEGGRLSHSCCADEVTLHTLRWLPEEVGSEEPRGAFTNGHADSDNVI